MIVVYALCGSLWAYVFLREARRYRWLYFYGRVRGSPCRYRLHQRRWLHLFWAHILLSLAFVLVTEVVVVFLLLGLF